MPLAFTFGIVTNTDLNGSSHYGKIYHFYHDMVGIYLKIKHFDQASTLPILFTALYNL